MLNEQKISDVGTPPPNDVWRTSLNDTWHAFLSGLPHPDFPMRTRGTLLLSGLSLGRGTRHSRTLHLDDRHIASGRPTYPIRICLFGSLTEVSKSCTSFQQPATISNSRNASHDLCQLPVGWWWPCHHLEASWQSQNISLPLKRETKFLTLYIWTFIQGGR